jgi:hypothetical protein
MNHKSRTKATMSNYFQSTHPNIIGKMLIGIKKSSFFLEFLGRQRQLFAFLFLVGVGGMFLAACANGEQEQSDVPVIVLSPQSGGANTQVVVTGENFPVGTAVTLRLGPPDVGATPFSYASGAAGGDGRFTMSFHVPAAWPDGMPITEAVLTVIALNDDGSVKATAPFTLEASVVTTTSTVQEPVDGGVMTPDPDLVANEQAIVNSVTNWLIQSGDSAQVAISVEQIEAEFARVGVVSLQADDAGGKSVGFLKLVNEVWEVLVIGRDFDTEQLLELGIPTTILPEEMVVPEG